MRINKEIECLTFDGFYESIFLNSDSFYGLELEDKKALKQMLNVDVDVEYEFQDINQYYINVCTEYCETYYDRIKDILDSLFNDEFVFEFDGFTSATMPKTYNYNHDRCYFDIITNNKTLEMIKDHVLYKIKDFTIQYLKDHFTSYDGFISFYSNDWSSWCKDISEYNEYEISVLLVILLLHDDMDNKHEIGIDVYNEIDIFQYVYSCVNDMDIYNYIKQYCETIAYKYGFYWYQCKPCIEY